MSRKVKIGLVAFVVLMTIFIVWLPSSGSGSGSSKKSGTKKGTKTATVYTNWDETYILASKQPKGLYHWNTVLRLHLQPTQPIATIDYLYSIDTIPQEVNPTFVFIGNHFALYEEEVEALLNRIEKGAKLFVSGEKIDGSMYLPFFEKVRTGFFYDTIISVATSKKTYDFTARHQSFAIGKKWFGYKETIAKDSLEFQSLSGYGNLMNSGVINYGKGKVYFNTTPELFTNYQFLTTEGYAYSKVWLNDIPSDQPVYWLELARYEPPVYDPWAEYNESSSERDDSYLQFIFQDRNRVIALIVLTIGLILFVVFRSKRVRPVVPFIPKKRNVTLIFADTITSIYFNQRNPYAMVSIQKANFYGIVQKHFHIDLSKETTEKDIHSFAQKSNVSEGEINKILRKFDVLKEQNTSEYELSELRKMILNFYRKSGLISARTQEKLEHQVYVAYRNAWISGLFVLIGITLIFYGTYYLIQGIGAGVLLWFNGVCAIIVGMRRLMRPYLSWSNKEINLYPYIGKKKVFNLDDLTSVYQDDKECQLHFENATIRVRYRELNKDDAKRFKRFVDVHNKLK